MEMVMAPANSRSTAADALVDFEGGPGHADDVLSQHLSNSNLRGSDRALAADLFWGSVRWKGRLDSVIAPVFHGDFRRADPRMRVVLRMGAYQLFGQDRIPDHAAVSQTVEIAIQKLGRKAGGLANAILRRLARERERWTLPPEQSDEAGRLAFFHSHPRWLVKELIDRVGLEEAERALQLNNTRAPLTIRVHEHAASAEDVIDFLESRSITFSASEFLDGYYRLETTSLHQIQPILDRGWISVQDESAGLAVQLLDPQNGERILDLCAAPGGKAIAAAERVGGAGSVVAVDVSAERLEKLVQNISRVGIQNVEVVESDALHFNENGFDRVLCDAPCSSSGLLRKQPDVRWRRRAHHLPAQHQQQLELLSHASELVKPGGALVYSTCSIFKVENHEVITAFLKGHSEFYKEDARGFFPESVVGKHGDLELFTHVHGTDGSFASRLRRSPKLE